MSLSEADYETLRVESPTDHLSTSSSTARTT
jgi:hypothetical protein